MDNAAARIRVERQRTRLVVLQPGTKAHTIAARALAALEDDVQTFSDTRQMLESSWRRILRQ